MVEIIGPPRNAVRNRAIAPELHVLLENAAEDTGIEKIVIVSGGQTSNHAPELKDVVGGWTGSRRHDNGRAADIELVKGGSTLRFTDSDGSDVEDFVTASAAHGANGIGAGVHYMGPKRLHVGFGRSLTDTQQLVWGASGASVNAPRWLRIAARKGWNDPVNQHLLTAFSSAAAEFSLVSARDGVWLRRGPGLNFDRAKLLEAGTRLVVLGLDGDWARVDLEGDGKVDGHVFASFIGSGDLHDPAEGVEEPVDDELIVEAIAASSTKKEPRSRGGGKRVDD